MWVLRVELVFNHDVLSIIFRSSGGAELSIGLSIYYGNNLIDTFRYKLDRYDKKNEKDCFMLGNK